MNITVITILIVLGILFALSIAAIAAILFNLVCFIVIGIKSIFYRIYWINKKL